MNSLLNKTFRTIALPLIVLSLVLSPVEPTMHTTGKIAHAMPVEDVPTETYTGLTAGHTETSVIANTLTAGATGGTNWIMKVYRTMVRAMARAVIKSILNSTLNWINNGFNGNPLYVQNLQYYFKTAIDQEIGSFLAADSDLNFLCSPFRLSIKRALLLQRRSFGAQSSCTLSGVVGNFNNFVSGAQGEFSKGGWSAWQTMTVEPQNNPYGAYTLANLELSMRIESALGDRKLELNTGSGFLNWKDPGCVAQAKAAKERQFQNSVQYGDDMPATGADPVGPEDPNVTGPQENTDPNTCPTQTPGSVIAGQVNAQLPDDMRQLELAQEIDDIIGAVAVQLATRALGSIGLFGMASSNYADGTDPLGSYNQEEQAQYEHDRTQMIDDINVGIGDENSYAAANEVIQGRIVESQNLYTSVINCVIRKLATSTSAIGTSTEELIPEEQRIEAINDIRAASSTLFSTIISEKNSFGKIIARSDAIITNLNRILSAVVALTVNDQTKFIAISNQYATLRSKVHIASDVVQAKNNYTLNFVPRYDGYDKTVKAMADKYKCTLP